MSERMIFCLGNGRYESQGIGYQKNYHAFNKPVTEKRWNEILKSVREIFSDLKLELKDNNWSDEWKKVTTKQWKQLSEIPEFDKKVVEGIIGFELNLKKEETIDLDGCPVSKTTIKEALKFVAEHNEG